MTGKVVITERIHSVKGVMESQSVLIPDVDMLSEKMRAVPSGTTRDLGHLRQELAREHGADITCPVTTQKLLKVIAVIAHSAVTMRDPAAVPFWRVVDPEKPGSDRLAGGRGFIVAQQAREKAAKA